MSIVRRYGWEFNTSKEDDNGYQIYDDLGIEHFMIRKGEPWLKEHGTSLALHYQKSREIIWPELDTHEWSELCRDEILGSKITTIMGCASSGKALRMDATIYTPSGPVKMRDVQVGDSVCTPDGQTCLVSGVYPQGIKPSYRVSFSDGTFVECCAEHLWEVENSQNPGRNPGRVLSTKEMMEEMRLKCESIFSIKRTQPLYFRSRSVRVDPYTLGVLLGDGGLSNFNVCFSTADDEILERVRSSLPLDLCIKKSFRKHDYRIVKTEYAIGASNELKDELRSYGLWGVSSSEKFIPDDYLYNSQAVRREILRGLMDTDGSVLKLGNVEFHSTSLRLAEGVKFLVESIGGSCRIRSKIPKFTYKGIKKEGKRCYTLAICIREPRRLFHLNRKKNRLTKRIRGRFSRPIIKIERCGYAEMKCISVDSPKKLYVTDHCIPTHNTHSPSWIFLNEYWCYPEETCVLVSSTQIPALKKRIWAEITMLWQQGVERFPKLAGHLLDSAIAITTDSIEDCEPGQRKNRDMRKGIFGIACVSGGKFVGLSRYVGIKQKRMRLIADEAQMMADGFLSAFANLNNNDDFKACILGNPSDILDPLGRTAEPKGGWTDKYLEPSETTCWDTRFMDGRCVNLVGTSSPNFKYPRDKPRYKYLISQKKIDEVLSFFPKDSTEYYSQCLGVMKIGTAARRVLSRDLCERMGALEEVKWKDGNTTKIYFVDAAYGGDRCVAGMGEFGLDVDGKMTLAFGEPKIIPILIGSGKEPEEQIAWFVRQDCEDLGIPPENMGHDATGRGSLGTALARLWSAQTHPVEAGGRPTARPVNADISVLDEETGLMRLKRCDEHYDRLVSEFNFCVRYAVEAGQVRNMPDGVMSEFCARKWDIVKGDKRSVEPKDGTPNKPGFKQRMGKSPDEADWAAGIVEMARRKGFVIANLGSGVAKPPSSAKWMAADAERLEKLRVSRQLQSA